MKILLLGSGGREHALAWKLSRSSTLDALFIAPGNAGTREFGDNISVDPCDFEAVKKVVLEKGIDMVVVGPEAPLVAGISDFFKADEDLKNVSVIGPNKEASQLEGSKDFAKDFMNRHNIPTAKHKTFTKDTIKEGFAFLERLKAPYVLKADGLAAGKGVLILEDLHEAKKEFSSMLLDNKFGGAGARVVIEEFLKGTEMSTFVLTDGDGFKVLPEAKDYKRIGEGDTGLNTGGMGAVSPVPFAEGKFSDKVYNQIIVPTIKGLKADGIEYNGFIFIGIIEVAGEPYVIEYNCRLGDPETEVILPRLKSDLVDLFEGVATQTLSERDIEFDPRTATTVMMVSGGYPEAYQKGKMIYGLNAANNSLIFHAGTASDGPAVTTAGGRVLAVTSFGKDIEDALETSYATIENIEFEGAYYRKDIGQDLI
ncbi:phosphoribosylamine--glycine ligase [Brumimicrobium aurantiacum]|uniref:Phosphoribosylamine--glycine ligase n=1 Tax=Brumimicrobium aurantiacum TaxID=1737063 RepID=A0A3E1F1A0_9FLAO|nr:phosphoribosylamine--glycine ligase [Brumimicrobium aurantiacum]RFC55594.1 phosphoribosylamine--glycine ligase [Brumimicrobium aurantiacum]